jgi:hypothetical protein
MNRRASRDASSEAERIIDPLSFLYCASLAHHAQSVPDLDRRALRERHHV